jgi:hypothetical protein
MIATVRCILKQVALSMRSYCRDMIFLLIRKVWSADETKYLTFSMLKSQFYCQDDLIDKEAGFVLPPYAELRNAYLHTEKTSYRSDIVFITGRFRSGSTLLWNLFRNTENITAYYEPFNERCWFNGKGAEFQTDSTHRKVSEYGCEYKLLEELDGYYDYGWPFKNLYMNAKFWMPDMKRFIEILIEKSCERPVLQFNRIDFRLPWLRNTFPNAKIIHLYRHPRDQWCSTLRDINCFKKNETMHAFESHDNFYLLEWCRDLKYQFPFLNHKTAEHPYQLFYYLWKLSYIWGIEYGHYSISFEDLIIKPSSALVEMYHFLDMDDFDLTLLKALIEKPILGKWKKYAAEEWFEYHESKCEEQLFTYFSTMKLNRRDQ